MSRRLGFALTIPGAQLQAFARFADASGHRGPLTRQLITSWARDEARRVTPLTWARHLRSSDRSASTGLARIEPGTYVPKADTPAAAGVAWPRISIPIERSSICSPPLAGSHRRGRCDRRPTVPCSAGSPQLGCACRKPCGSSAPMSISMPAC
jgi:hypothetical protein